MSLDREDLTYLFKICEEKYNSHTTSTKEDESLLRIQEALRLTYDKTGKDAAPYYVIASSKRGYIVHV